MLVQHRFGDSCITGDGIHRRVVVPRSGERLQGYVEDLAAAFRSRQAGRRDASTRYRVAVDSVQRRHHGLPLVHHNVTVDT